MNLDLHGSTKSLKKERRFKFQNEHLMAGYSLSLTPTSNSPIAYSQSYILRRLKTWLGLNRDGFEMKTSYRFCYGHYFCLAGFCAPWFGTKAAPVSHADFAMKLL